MSHIVAGIDVHKKMLVVVLANAVKPDVELQSERFGTGADELRRLLEWLLQHGVAEAVMESTAQYWKPVWLELEPYMQLHLAQAQSNKAPNGRKSDLADAKRLVRRFVAGELSLSFVPESEQRGWRMLTRGRVQLMCERVQVHNQIESLLEEGRIKLSSVITDILGASGKRILRAMADGETSAEKLAELGDRNLKCGRPALVDALTGAMGPIHRQLLKIHLDRIKLIDEQIEQLDRLTAADMQEHQDTIARLVEVPGIGVTAAQEIVAEVGPKAKKFRRSGNLASWIAVCPGSNESAGVNHSSHCAKGNRFLRRILCQAAQAAARTNGSHLQSVFKKFVVRLGYVGAVWVVAHRICKIIWNILHEGARFIEYSNARNPKAVHRAITHHLKALRRLGYQIPDSPPERAPAA